MTALLRTEMTGPHLPEPARGPDDGSEPAPAAFPEIVPFPRWERARNRACAALLAGETRLLITGPAGSGKSTLLLEIARILRAAGWQASLRVPGAPAEEGPSQAGPQTVLLVDEADGLSDEELRSLDCGGLRAVALAGLDPLALRWEAGARVSLAPLTTLEAHDYMAQWLRLAGYDAGRFEAAALERILEMASGMPRLLSSLLAAASSIAAAGGSHTVCRHHVDGAAALRACFLENELPPAEPKALAPVLSEPSERPTAPAELQVPAAVAAPSPGQRRILLPVLAGCAVVLVAGAGAAYRFAPDRWEQAEALVRGKLAPYLSGPSASVEASQPAAPTLASAPAAAQPEPESVPLVLAAPVSTPAEPSAPIADTPATAAAEPATEPSEPAAPVQSAAAAEPPAAPSEPASPPAPVQTVAEATSVSAPMSPPPDVPGPEPYAAGTDVASPPAPAAEPSDEPRGVEAERAPAQEAVPAPHPAPLSPALIETLLRRGDEMLALGDFASARLLFGRAAQAGDARAMLALGRTYDPASFGAHAPRPGLDRDAAARWYAMAAARGSEEATLRLQQVDRQTAR